MDSMNPSPEGDASATRRGLVNLLAQVFAGAKSFVDLLTASSGLVVNGDVSGSTSILAAHDIVSFSGNIYGSLIKSGSGAASGVAYGPSADANTGLWFPAGDTINVVTGGVLRAQFDASGVVWIEKQLTLDSAGRSINVPQIVLPGSSGGYGYGGGLEIGGFANMLQHDGARLYMQAYGSGVYAEVASVFGDSRVTGFNGAALGAFDTAVKVGTRSLRAVNTVGSKLLSIRDGIGDATETEYAYFNPIFTGGASAFRTVLVLDQKGQTHVGGINIINSGIGSTGLFFEGAGGAGGVEIGIGDQAARGLKTYSTNRSQSWYINSGAYSTGARALYDWEATEDATQKTLPFARFQADSAHTGDLARWYKGATLEASLSANGILTAVGVIAEGGLSVYAGGSFFNGGVTLEDDEPIKLTNGNLGDEDTVPPVGVEHEITMNTAKGRAIHSGSYGTTKVNCDKCTANSVVVVMMEDVNYAPYCVQPDDGFFYIRNDGGGYDNWHFRFIVFN